MDMNSCKPGDKLVCRNGTLAEYINRKGTPHFPHWIRYEKGPTIGKSEIETVNDDGFITYIDDGFDIISFAQKSTLAVASLTKDELLSVLNDYRSFQETGTLRDGLLREQVADKPPHLLAVTVPYVMLDIFLPYAEKAIKDI